MKKTILLGAILVAGVVSAFPFRTSCGKVLQVSNSYAQLSNSALADVLEIMNGDACPKDKGIATVTVIYSH